MAGSAPALAGIAAAIRVTTARAPRPSPRTVPPAIFRDRDRLAAFALRQRIATIFALREQVIAGGLSPMDRDRVEEAPGLAFAALAGRERRPLRERAGERSRRRAGDANYSYRRLRPGDQPG